MTNPVDRLLELRGAINTNLLEIEDIIKSYFPKQYENSYQHWIPQIITALYNDTKWLPRGELTLQDTINQIIDIKITDKTSLSNFIRKN